jgi:hypothetical protein
VEKNFKAEILSSYQSEKFPLSRAFDLDRIRMLKKNFSNLIPREKLFPKKRFRNLSANNYSIFIINEG